VQMVHNPRRPPPVEFQIMLHCSEVDTKFSSWHAHRTLLLLLQRNVDRQTLEKFPRKECMDTTNFSICIISFLFGSSVHVDLLVEQFPISRSRFCAHRSCIHSVTVLEPVQRSRFSSSLRKWLSSSCESTAWGENMCCYVRQPKLYSL